MFNFELLFFLYHNLRYLRCGRTYDKHFQDVCNHIKKCKKVVRKRKSHGCKKNMEIFPHFKRVFTFHAFASCKERTKVLTDEHVSAEVCKHNGGFKLLAYKNFYLKFLKRTTQHEF